MLPFKFALTDQETKMGKTGTNQIGASANWLTNADPDLRQIVAVQKRPLLLVGASASDERRGCKAAAEDAHEAAASLARVAGLDVRHLLPSVEDLAETLYAAPRRRVASSLPGTSREGASARVPVRSAEVPLAKAGVRLALAGGSGMARGDLLARAIAADVTAGAVPVAGIFASRADRIARSTPGMSAVMNELSALESRVGDQWSGDGWGSWSLPELRFFAYVAAAESQHMAGRSALARRAAAASKTAAKAASKAAAKTADKTASKAGDLR